MLVYDVSNRESFDALDSWLEEIKKDIGNPADFEGVAFAVCANKVRKKSISRQYLILWKKKKKHFVTSILTKVINHRQFRWLKTFSGTFKDIF